MDEIGMVIVFSILSLVITIPLVALLLWATTFITIVITFSWIFVFVIAGILSLIIGIIFVASLD